MKFDTATTHRIFVNPDLRAGAIVNVEREQANYLFNVLRLQAGSIVNVFNGRDGEWHAALEGSFKKAATLKILHQTRQQTLNPDIHYYFAPLKSARLDYLMQKGVEMGASHLGPVITRRTQAARFNMARARANIIEAAEQCEILALPTLSEPVKFERLLADWQPERGLVFCDEDAPLADPVAALGHIKRGAPCAVIIGPEGGFDAAERAALAQVPNVVRLSLGPRILRADTAAVAALTVLQITVGDMY